MSPLLVWILLSLALVAVLAALRLFAFRPPDRPPDWRSAARGDPRSALRGWLEDPASAPAREAEARGDWASARAEYARALEDAKREGIDDPAAALQRRALESKIEELDRLASRG